MDADNLGGLVRLGVAPTFGPYFLPHFLPKLHKLYPALEVYIREDRPNVLESDLKEGKLDCIITPMPLATDGFETMPFCIETVFLGVPSEHMLSRRTSVSMSDLAGEKLLTLGRGHRLFEQVSRLCDISGAQLRSDYEGHKPRCNPPDGFHRHGPLAVPERLCQLRIRAGDRRYPFRTV